MRFGQFSATTLSEEGIVAMRQVGVHVLGLVRAFPLAQKPCRDVGDKELLKGLAVALVQRREKTRHHDD